MSKNTEPHHERGDSAPPNCRTSSSGNTNEASSQISSCVPDRLCQPDAWSSIPPDEPFEASPPSQLHNAQSVNFFGDSPTDHLYTYTTDAFWGEYDMALLEESGNMSQPGDNMSTMPTSIDPRLVNVNRDQESLESQPPDYRKYMVQREGWLECSCPLPGCTKKYSGQYEWKRKHEPLDLTCPKPGCGARFTRKDVMNTHVNNPRLHLG